MVRRRVGAAPECGAADVPGLARGPPFDPTAPPSPAALVHFIDPATRHTSRPARRRGSTPAGRAPSPLRRNSPADRRRGTSAAKLRLAKNGVTARQPSMSWLIGSTVSAAPFAFASASRSGISAMHGTHHVAHRLTSTRLPRKSASVADLPSRVSNATAGAGVPAWLRSMAWSVPAPCGVAADTLSPPSPQPATQAPRRRSGVSQSPPHRPPPATRPATPFGAAASAAARRQPCGR